MKEFLLNVLKKVESGDITPIDASDIIIADIRNKLGSIYNFISLYEYNRDYCSKFIQSVKDSIKYLSNK